MHNDAVSLFGSCRCACHVLRSLSAQAMCWCDPRKAGAARTVSVTAEEVDALKVTARRAGVWLDGPAIAHNDYVRHFGACRCTCHTRTGGRCWCSGPTAPDVADALRRKDDRDLRKRLATGRATPTEYARHMPGMLTRRPNGPLSS